MPVPCPFLSHFKSVQTLQSFLFNIHFNIILPPMSRSPMLSLTFRYYSQNPVGISFSLPCKFPCPVKPIHLHLVIMCTMWMVPSPSHGTICTVHTTYTAALKTTTLPKTRCRKPYAATQHLMLLMMGVCTLNMLS